MKAARKGGGKEMMMLQREPQCKEAATEKDVQQWATSMHGGSNDYRQATLTHSGCYGYQWQPRLSLNDKLSLSSYGPH